MRVLLTGASGFIGCHLAQALKQAGHRVIPLSRRDGTDMTQLIDPSDWLPRLREVDAVINAAGIIGERGPQTFQLLHEQAASALFKACTEARVHRVVQISALGADTTAFSGYHLSKQAADDVLRRLPLDWFVLRPALVYGPGGTSASFLLRLAACPVIPVVGDGRQKLQPVYVGDVVDAVIECLSAPTTRLTLDIPGPETVGLGDWLRRLRSAQGLAPAPLLHVPGALALALVTLGQVLSPMFRPANLRMLEAGQDADMRPIERFLGRSLRQATPELLFPTTTPRNEAS